MSSEKVHPPTVKCGDTFGKYKVLEIKNKSVLVFDSKDNRRKNIDFSGFEHIVEKNS